VSCAYRHTPKLACAVAARRIALSRPSNESYARASSPASGNPTPAPIVSADSSTFHEALKLGFPE
jgi:hypothetical protein